MKRFAGLLLPVAIIALTVSGCAWGKKASAPEAPAFSADAVFKEGNEKLKKGKYDEAREAFMKVQQEDLDKNYDIVTRLRIADSYYEEGRYEEAVTEYHQFLNMHPTHKLSSYAQYQVAMSYFKQISTIDRNARFFKDALTNFQGLIEKYPKSPYLDESKERIRILNNKAAEYELYVAKFYFNKGSYNAAINRLDSILNDMPQSAAEAEVLYHLAVSYENLKDREKAKKYYSLLIEKYPKEEQKFKASSRLSKLNAKK
ncbi:MAG: outer membrane protein assembly factor BamD [Nitrospirota bacterium]|nr:outer membrane protein assembly factor BamD [Nitrospirota bacterium]